MTERKALLIGCGVAGPVLAMFLQRAGIIPIVYEGRPDPRDEAGFFLNLAPNGLAVLDTLGIKDEIIKHGTPTTSIVFQNHHGTQLTENPETTTLIKRGLLTKALREAAIERGVTVEFGKRLTDIETTAQHSVTAHFDDGAETNGDFLVGCDGIHSQTRRAIMPDAPQPNYAGVIDSGGFTHNTSVSPSDGVFRMTFGMQGFFGYQVVPSGEIYWFENHHQPTEPDRKQLDSLPNTEWRQKLLDRHRDDHDPILKIIRSTEEIGKWPNYEMPSLPTWHKGSVCLIGDATHAMLPSAGQGASMAIEDAVVLAKCLRDRENPEEAFTAFEDLRKDRVEEVATNARRNSNRKTPSNVVTRKIRDLVLPFFLRMGVKSAKRTYSYRIDWSETVRTTV